VPRTSDAAARVAELEAALLRAVRREWHGLCQDRFRGALRPPVFALDEAQTRLAAWLPAARTITVSRALLQRHPWLAVREVLAHEMAHQYVTEVLRVTDETAHGAAFRDVCARFGVDPRAAGLPDAEGEVDPVRDRLARRVAKLLALAESPNAHEAEAAAAAARRLLLQYNLEVVPRGHTFRQLGGVEARTPEHRRVLANLLSSHYFVETIWVPAHDAVTGRDGRALEAVGTPENLEMASYVHEFLLEAAWRLWKAHRAATGAAGERARQRFVAGVMRGFGEKVAEGTRRSAEEGLVWVGDPEVARTLRRLHPRVRTIRYGGRVPDADHEHGREAGRGIVLHRPVTAGPTAADPRRIGGSGGGE
jgi:hypothetical protein